MHSETVRSYSLDSLIAAITEENRHEETPTGPAVGREFPNEPELNVGFKSNSAAPA